MSRASRFKGIISVYSGIGGLLLAILGFIPEPLAESLNAPLYVGYQLTVLSTLLIGITLGVYYISNVIKDETEKTRDTINQGEFLEIVEETSSEEEEEQVATDGGKSFTQSNSMGNINQDYNEDEDKNDVNLANLLRQFSIEPTGKGVLAGIVIGGVLGLSLGTNGVFIGGILGGLIGNEIEYQIIKRKRLSIIGLESKVDSSTSLSSDLVYDILKNPYRRSAIELLGKSDGEMHVEELSSKIAEMQQGPEVETRQTSKGAQIYAELYETHLPKLEQAGFIKFDKSRGVIRVQEKFTDFRPYLQQDQNLKEVGNRAILYDLLKNRRRRYVIQILLEEDRPVQLSELAEQVASLENGIPIEELPAKERKRVYTALYQSHLRKMDDAGVLNFDPKSGIVEIDEDIDELRPFRIPDSKITVTLPLYYSLISVLAFTVYVGDEVGLQIFEQISIKIWFLTYIVSVSAVSFYQLLTES